MSDEDVCRVPKIANLKVLDPRALELVRQLEEQSGRTTEVRFNRNRWIYFSCESIPGNANRVRLNLHESFLDAPPEVLRALATLIRRNDAEARRIVSAFIETQSPLWENLSARQPRPPRINPRGQVYDLQSILDALNRRYFDGTCTARITWGNGTRSLRGKRHVTFGSYDEETGIIRIHPALDRRRVPKYFVCYITYHEMLHSTLPSTLSPSGKRLYHSQKFRQMERRFEDFERAKLWGNRFLGMEV